MLNFDFWKDPGVEGEVDMWNLYKCLVRHHLIFYCIGPFDYTNLASLTYHYHVFLHSTGPCKFITSPLRATANWNFIAWISLCPLNNVLWLLFGLQTGQSCPSCPSYRGCRICLTIVHGCSFSMHFFRKQFQVGRWKPDLLKVP